MKPPTLSTQQAPQCEAAPASGLGAPLRRERAAGEGGGTVWYPPCPGVGTGRGLTCQQQQQLPQAVLVQVQGILLPASFLLLQTQGTSGKSGLGRGSSTTPAGTTSHPPSLGTDLGHGSSSHFQGSQEAWLVPGHLWDKGQSSG